ncbi:hypothetical protein INT47_009242 [Mucor saturninus]|uniref:Transposase domain-containing protein n=1 Tax=Mucor saturninus TaxID=64648 RepID=A0A8H7QHT8_9FUNG|nr:hypothetical protein INT47_009242 [Mucor saturninus]
MSSSNTFYNTKCYCNRCNNNGQGYTLVASRTAQRHSKRARIEQSNSNEIGMIISVFIFMYSVISTQQSGPSDVLDGQTNSPFWDADVMLDEGDSVANEANADGERDDESDDEEDEGEDEVEIEVEEFDSEDPFPTPNMPENPVHRFIAVFVVLFASRYVVNKGAVVLIEFINTLLTIYEQDFQLPSSLLGLQRMTGYSAISNGIRRFVACPDCHAVYEENQSVPPHCVFTKVGARLTCNCKLTKVTSSGALVPKRVFQYQSLKHALKILFLRPDFEASIQHWNQELKIMDTMCDIFDGVMWKELKDISGESFVAHPRSLMLTLNIDWFQPFDRVTYSCGAIYLVVNNLPREERFKAENTILVGLMPGPKEPKSEEINHYLKPLVDELEQLYVGMTIPTFECISGATVRAALFMVACDIPAARKTSGFTSHNSTNACYKCCRKFSRLPGTSSVDFRGFNESGWRRRRGVENRLHAEVWKSASTPSERHELEVENGVRWSQLHRLGYFDLVRGTIIDPMHNLFLGTAKRMVETWTTSGLITDRKLASMQVMAESMVVPTDYTILKTKISRGFPYMKADEWKSWVLVYSPVLLRDVLPLDKFKNWIDFVDACRLLATPTITFDDLDDAHAHLERFCQKCEELYPAPTLTCNMHLHIHLRETIRDFGPVYGYWLFGFERYNGLLKKIDTNRRDGFESTFMKTFVEDMYKGDYVQKMLSCPNQASFRPLLSKLTSSSTTATSSSAPLSHTPFILQLFVRASLKPEFPIKGNEPLPLSAFPLLVRKPSVMDDTDYLQLLEYYRLSYGIPSLQHYHQATSSGIFVDNHITKIKSINLLGQTYKGKNGSVDRGSFIQALFLGRVGDPPRAYTGQIQYLFLHKLSCSSIGNNSTHVFAFVRWLINMPSRTREYEGVEVCSPSFSPDDYHCILPVHRILLEVATAELVSGVNVKMLVIPLPKKMYA